MNVESSGELKYFGSTKIVPGVYYGRLMSLTEVATATADRPEDEKRRMGAPWVLCGDVTPGLFDVLRSGRLMDAATERVTAFASPAGGTYAVFTNQVGNFQHRFLLPLYEQRVAAFLATMGQGTLAYCLGGDGQDALTWKSRLVSRDLIPLQPLCTPLDAEGEMQVAMEYPQVIKDMTRPDRIPSTRHPDVVRHVSLTLVPPDTALVAYARSVLGDKP